MSKAAAKKVNPDSIEAITDLPFSGNAVVKARKRAFLLGLLETGTVSNALRHANLVIKSGKHKGSPQYYHWKWWTRPVWQGEENPRYDPTFVEAVELVQEVIQDKVRNAILKRAIEGWDEPVYGNVNGVTQQVGTIRKYDSRLLQWLGDHVLPEGRKENGVQNAININVNNDNRQVHLHAVKALDDMSPTLKRWVLQLLELTKRDDGDRVLDQAQRLLWLADGLAKVNAGEALPDVAREGLVRLVKEQLSQQDLLDILPKMITHQPALLEHHKESA